MNDIANAAPQLSRRGLLKVGLFGSAFLATAGVTASLSGCSASTPATGYNALRASDLPSLRAIIPVVLEGAVRETLEAEAPRVMAVLKACGVAMALVVVATFFTVSPVVALVANVVLIVAVGATVVATATAARRRERAAWFLALSSTPLLVAVAWRAGGLLGAWPMPDGLAVAFPVVLALAGLLLTLGLSDKMQQLRRDRDRASELAAYDGLTGAASRQMIEDQLAAAVAGAHRQGQPLSVVFFDIDHFKRINDELGHAAGDQALVQSVARIRAEMRTEDVLGRLGGEEFIVLMPNSDGASATAAAERIREAFSARPLDLRGQPRKVTLSIGVAVLAPADRLFSQLLQRGDRAMYAAKHAGRDLVMADAMSGWDNGPG
mgnify:CR=1 FL=1